MHEREHEREKRQNSFLCAAKEEKLKVNAAADDATKSLLFSSFFAASAARIRRGDFSLILTAAPGISIGISSMLGGESERQWREDEKLHICRVF
jgi:hypothetical protein